MLKFSFILSDLSCSCLCRTSGMEGNGLKKNPFCVSEVKGHCDLPSLPFGPMQQSWEFHYVFPKCSFGLMLDKLLVGSWWKLSFTVRFQSNEDITNSVT